MEKYSFHPSVTVDDFLQVAKLLGVEYESNSKPFSDVIRNIEEALLKFANKFQETDPTSDELLCILQLFDPELRKAKHDELYLARIQTLWKFLLPNFDQPVRNVEGHRLSDSYWENSVPNIFSGFKDYVKKAGIQYRVKQPNKHLSFDSQRNDVINLLKINYRTVPVPIPPEVEAKRKQQVIGKGGTGRVHTIAVFIDSRHNRFPCAQKIPLDQNACKRFISEVTNCKKIIESKGHPNIIYIHEALYNKTNAHIIMQYHPTNLVNIMNKKDEKIVDQPLTWLLDIARALEYLHTKLNLVHTDIKESNVLISTDSRAVLIDFDAAQEPLTEEDRKKKKKMVSTSSSINRSQISSGDFSFDVDIYNWSVIANNILDCRLKDCPELTGSTPAKIKEIILSCQGDIIKRPTGSDIKNFIFQLISSQRSDLGINISSNLPDSPWKFNENGVTSIPLIQVDERNIEAEHFALDLQKNTNMHACLFRLVSLNVKNFSLDQTQETSNRAQKLHGLAKNIHDVSPQLIVLTEIKDGNKDYYYLCDVLKNGFSKIGSGTSDQWDVCLSNNLSKNKNGTERIALIYDSSLISIDDEGILVEVQAGNIDMDIFERVPYFVKLHVGNSKFLLICVHLKPESKSPQEEIRQLSLIFDWIADQKLYSDETNLMILGDFNTPCDQNVFDGFRERGWYQCYPSCVNTNRKDDKQWDNIFCKFIESNGVLCEKVKPICSQKSDNIVKDGLSDHQMLILDHSYIRGPGIETTRLLPSINFEKNPDPKNRKRKSQ